MTKAEHWSDIELNQAIQNHLINTQKYHMLYDMKAPTILVAVKI